MAKDERSPLVGIVMGSDSDLKIMSHAVFMLDRFDVPYEPGIKSAHRTPERMAAYARAAIGNGLEVIIAGAGGSAHLPGMLAPETRLPILGVAIESSPDPTNAAIGSMIRMPKGVPLATMGKNEAAAANAALFAVRILALKRPELAEAYDSYVAELAAESEEKDARLLELDVREYLANM